MANACAGEDAVTALQASLQSAAARLQAGKSLAEIKGMSHADCEAIHDAVHDLIREDKHAEALPSALMLAAHAPADGRFSFAAGYCLQITGAPGLALAFYGVSLHAREDAATVLRLGECWAAVGNVDEALRCFEAVPLLCEDGDTAELVSIARAAARSVQDQRSFAGREGAR
jgi:hypothetical protein